ncbi:MAG: TonB-dependent receptor [Myxococcota bacterium]
MSPPRIIFAICLGVLGLPEAVFAHSGSGSLDGHVVEVGSSGRGVSGATVRIEGASRETVTDGEGRFTFEGVPALPLVLLVEAPNYRPARRVLSSPLSDEPLIIELTWLGEVIAVRGTSRPRRIPKTASTFQVTARDITAAPRRNAEEILRQVPGLTLVQHGSEGKGHQFFLRGFDAIHGADLELTVDGMPINEWSNVHAQGYLDLGFILPEMVRGVEATKGPFTLDQGAFAMAGSARYRLGVVGDNLGWRAAYTVGTTNRHRIFAGYSPPEENGEQFFGVGFTHDDGFGDNRAIDRATLNGRVRLFDGPAGRLMLTALGHYSEFDLPGTLRNLDVEAGTVDFFGGYDPSQKGTSGRAMVGLSYIWETAEQELRLSAYGGYRRLELLENFTGFLVDPKEGDRREQLQDTWSFGFEAAHHLHLATGLALRTSLGLRGDQLSQTEYNIGLQLQRTAARRDLEGLQMIAHGRAGLSWQPASTLRVDAGARFDVVYVSIDDRLGDAPGDGTILTVSPRVTTRWSPLPAWQFFLAYGRGFRPPEARAFSTFEPARSGIGEEVFTGGDPTSTTSDAFEVGLRWDPTVWFGTSLSGFATFIERESIFDHVSGINLELNGTRRLGGELLIVLNPFDWLQLGADATLVDARFVESGNRVPLAPWLVSGLRATITHESGFRAGLRVLAVMPRPLPHGATGATLVMTDATLGYWWRWLRLDLEIENVLNRRLREGEYHYASHWRFGEPASEIPVLHINAGAPLNARLTVGVVF